MIKMKLQYDSFSSKVVNKFRNKIWSRCYASCRLFLPFFPPEIFLEVTNHCNLKCIMCPHGYKGGLKRGKGVMDLALFHRIIDQCRGHYNRISLFFAGEPLLNKNIIHMINYCKDAGLRTRIHSNATTLSGELSRGIIESGLDELSFSFDAPDKTTYEKTRCGANFDKTLENIITFLKIKKELNSLKPYTILQFIHLENEGMQKREESYKELFKEYHDSIDHFMFRYAHSWAGSYKEEVFSKSKEYGGHYFPCNMLWNRMVINWNGDVNLCCNDLEGTCILGNLHEESVRHAWNNRKIRHVRQMFAQRTYKDIPVCASCEIPFSSNKNKFDDYK